MKDDEIISPTWDETEDFLQDQDAAQDVMVQFHRLKRKAEAKGRGEMKGLYPVLYAEQNGSRRGYSIDYDLFVLPQRDDFEDLIDDPNFYHFSGSKPLTEGTVNGSSELPEGIEYS